MKPVIKQVLVDAQDKTKEFKIMKKLIIGLLLIFGNLSAGENSSDYFTYDEFIKIKSYFSEDGCAGIEKFLQSSKELNVSDDWYNISEKLQDANYQTLCLLAGSIAFTVYAEKDSLGNYKKSWVNRFPKNTKATAISFYSPSVIMSKCKNKNDLYMIHYTKYHNQYWREVYDGSIDYTDYTKPDKICITSQLPIFKSKPQYGVVTHKNTSIKEDIVVKTNLYPDSKQWDKISTGQKVRILGSIKNLSYVYYNKKTKGACDPLHMVDGCNSGWVDTSFIDTIQSSKTETLSFDDYKKSIHSFLPPKNEYESKIVRNLPYAIRGYIFHDKKVQEFYESMNWYVADKNYRPDSLKLSESEQQWIDQWK